MSVITATADRMPERLNVEALFGAITRAVVNVGALTDNLRASGAQLAQRAPEALCAAL